MTDSYKLIERKVLYRGKKVTVFDEKIQLPNGNIVEWDMVEFPDIYMAIPVTNKKTVLLVQQWRQGPKAITTDFVGVRLDDPKEDAMEAVKRELNEELGIVGGKYEKLVEYTNGVRISGVRSIYLLVDFEQSEQNLDENELVDIIELPVKGLYKELSENHVVTGDTLLMAKLVEEKYCI
jgi:ADP-ribose pyrophosphatase